MYGFVGISRDVSSRKLMPDLKKMSQWALDGGATTSEFALTYKMPGTSIEMPSTDSPYVELIRLKSDPSFNGDDILLNNWVRGLSGSQSPPDTDTSDSSYNSLGRRSMDDLDGPDWFYRYTN